MIDLVRITKGFDPVTPTMKNTMRLWTKVAFALLFVPLVASAQFKDLDAALSNLERGFGGGDVQAIVAGITNGEKVMLQFPGLADESGFFGRDQTALLLDRLFNRAKPNEFEPTSSKKVSSEDQYIISGRWTVAVDGKSEQRALYVTLRKTGDRYAIASIKSAGK
jgi:hypothetical protein